MERNARIQIIIGISLIVAAVLIVVSAYSLLSSGDSPEEIQALTQDGDEQRHNVLIAARPLPRGTQLVKADALLLTVVGKPPQGAMIQGNIVDGKTALEDIEQGQILMETLLTDKPNAAGLSAVLDDGKRAIAIRVSEESGLANLLLPGDRVDVQLVLRQDAIEGREAMRVTRPTDDSASEPLVPEGDPSEARMLLQDVEVIAVGPLIKGDEGTAIEPYRTVSLVVTPQQASTVALARELGNFALSLRGAEDRAVAADRTITVTELRGPDAIAKKREEALRQERLRNNVTHEVQVINGSKVEMTEIKGTR